jgi:cytochrome c-type biogenesis protein CcmH
MSDPSGVEWGPALAVLAAGLVVGAILVWRLLAKSREARATAKIARTASVQVRDLEGKRDALVRQLRELEDTASKRTPEQLARERYAMELETARALLALEEHDLRARPKAGRRGAEKRMSEKRGDTRRAAENRAGLAPQNAALRGFFWGVGTVAGLALLGFFVYQSAKPREPGGSVTGEPGMASRSAPAPAQDAEEAQIQAALSANPEDVEARLALAQLYVSRSNWMGVWNETGKVLQKAPGNPRALAYQSLVRLAMGQADVALDLLKKAVAADPKLSDAYGYMALVYARTGRMREAESTIASASKRFPERAADFRQLLADLKKGDQGQIPVAAADSDPHSRLATPGQQVTAASTASAPGVRRVAGTIDLDPALKSSFQPNAILFVFVRAAGAAGGPPVAVKRLPPVFPASFELSEADSMMGQPFPDPVLIEARLDSDGDPTTRPPTDPKARLDRVRAGRTDVRLLLKRD